MDRPPGRGDPAKRVVGHPYGDVMRGPFFKAAKRHRVSSLFGGSPGKKQSIPEKLQIHRIAAVHRKGHARYEVGSGGGEINRRSLQFFRAAPSPDRCASKDPFI